MKSHAVVLLVLTSLLPDAGILCAGQTPDDVKLLKVRQKDFEVVWQTIAENYYDPTFGGVDWKRVRQQYEGKIPSLHSDEEFYGMLNMMLSELGRSHLGLIPPEAFNEEAARTGSGGNPGIDVLFIDDQALITKVLPGSAAERAGIRQGFIVEALEGTSISQLAEQYQKRMFSAPLKRASIAQAIMRRINGPVSTPLRISYVDENNQAHQATIVREARVGNVVKPGGGLPPFYVDFKSTRLVDGIGYIGFSFFIPAVYNEVLNAIKAMSDAPGVIIDLRGNTGGFGEAESDIAGLLVKRETTLSVCTRRNSTEKYVARPKKDAYQGPIVLLVNLFIPIERGRYGRGASRERTGRRGW